MRKRRLRPQDADLDITSFMNLMIVLVPVLLLNMVFSHITVLELKLPDPASSSSEPVKDPAKETLELVIYADQLRVNYPAGNPLKIIPKIENEETGELVYDFKLLSDTLQELKRLLRNQKVEKDDILILSQPDTDYQTIVKAMDTARSFKVVQAAAVVDGKLFPVISLGDAPTSKPSSGKGKRS